MGSLSNISSNKVNVYRFVLYCKLYSSSVVIVINCFRAPHSHRNFNKTGHPLNMNFTSVFDCHYLGENFCVRYLATRTEI